MKKVLKVIWIIILCIIALLIVAYSLIEGKATLWELFSFVCDIVFILVIIYYRNKTDKLENKVNMLEEWLLWGNEELREFKRKRSVDAWREWEEDKTQQPTLDIYEIITDVKLDAKELRELGERVEKLEKKQKSKK